MKWGEERPGLWVRPIDPEIQKRMPEIHNHFHEHTWLWGLLKHGHSHVHKHRNPYLEVPWHRHGLYHGGDKEYPYAND